MARIPLNDACRAYRFTADNKTKLVLKQIKLEQEQTSQKKKNLIKHASMVSGIKLRTRQQSHRSVQIFKKSMDQIILYRKTTEN